MGKKENKYNNIKELNLPTYKEIPDVGLYLDQVTKFINDYLGSYPNMEVTSSMISNYIKHNIVRRVNKKTYTRAQIAMFIFIILSKSVLSMDNIQSILKDISIDNCEDFYESFRENLLSIIDNIDDLGKNKKYGDEELINNLCITIAYKFYLDSYFQNQ